jgi:hypothetical protein
MEAAEITRLKIENNGLRAALLMIARAIEEHQKQVPGTVLETSRLVATYAALSGSPRAPAQKEETHVKVHDLYPRPVGGHVPGDPSGEHVPSLGGGQAYAAFAAANTDAAVDAAFF